MSLDPLDMEINVPDLYGSIKMIMKLSVSDGSL